MTKYTSQNIIEKLLSKAADVNDSGDAMRFTQAAANVAHIASVASGASDPGSPSWPPSQDQIKHMVDRFLRWRLPVNFSPDGGITFTPEFNVEYMAQQGKPPMRHDPSGTNLFDATQATAMVSYMIDGFLAP